MAPNLDHAEFDPSARPGPLRRAGLGLPAGFLRLVQGAPERAAIATGQVDAVVDPASGKVFLLPDAQQAMHARQARASRLLALAADWTWEQDEDHRFTSHAGTGARARAPCEVLVLGKSLWELGLLTRPDLEWRTHRQQIEWRATFRDLELGWTTPTGDTRWVSLDGEPVFDAQDRFTGYRGTLRDITDRERLRAFAQAWRESRGESLDEPPEPLPRAAPGETQGEPVANALLAALPLEDRQRLAAELKPVSLACGDVLCTPGERIRYVYFPTDALVSLRTSVKDGLAMEVGLVGREGMVGVSVALGSDVSTVRAVVLQGGAALRMSAARFRRLFRESLPLQAESCRFIQAKLAVARQTAACARFHLLEARLAGWLLGACDRIGSAELHFTHDTLATVLGVRRSGVTHAAAELERRRLISYRRGDIRVLDRHGLEAASCGCYTALKGMRLPGHPAHPAHPGHPGHAGPEGPQVAPGRPGRRAASAARSRGA